jgi:hypothetical protein
MMTWTLYLLLALPSGGWGYMKHSVHTTEMSCLMTEQFVAVGPPPESMRLVSTICKERIDV